MKKTLPWLTVTLLVGACPAAAAELECTVLRKVDSTRVYSVEELRQGRFSVLVDENAEGATLARCSFAASAQKVTCDRYPVDRIERDPRVGHKKFYVFRSHFDVQVFSDLSFVENNGRGGIAFGTCRAVAP